MFCKHGVQKGIVTIEMRGRFYLRFIFSKHLNLSFELVNRGAFFLASSDDYKLWKKRD